MSHLTTSRKLETEKLFGEVDRQEEKRCGCNSKRLRTRQCRTRQVRQSKSFNSAEVTYILLILLEKFEIMISTEQDCCISPFKDICQFVLFQRLICVLVAQLQCPLRSAFV